MLNWPPSSKVVLTGQKTTPVSMTIVFAAHLSGFEVIQGSEFNSIAMRDIIDTQDVHQTVLFNLLFFSLHV